MFLSVKNHALITINTGGKKETIVLGPVLQDIALTPSTLSVFVKRNALKIVFGLKNTISVTTLAPQIGMPLLPMKFLFVRNLVLMVMF